MTRPVAPCLRAMQCRRPARPACRRHGRPAGSEPKQIGRESAGNLWRSTAPRRRSVRRERRAGRRSALVLCTPGTALPGEASCGYVRAFRDTRRRSERAQSRRSVRTARWLTSDRSADRFSVPRGDVSTFWRRCARVLARLVYSQSARAQADLGVVPLQIEASASRRERRVTDLLGSTCSSFRISRASCSTASGVVPQQGPGLPTLQSDPPTG